MQYIISLIVFSVMISLSFSATAAEHSILYSQDSTWIVERIEVAADGWPEVKEHKLFPTRELALQQKQLWDAQPLRQAVPAMRLADATLWPTKNAWSVEWEQKYASWIENEVDSEFFLKNKVATDCADVAYALRWIFSRINGLPVAAHLGGVKALMTNETARPEWSKLATASEWQNDKRFRAALDYVLNLTYTHTLHEDSFPVALNKETVLSGSYYLSLHDSSGHTQVIHWLPGNHGVPFMVLNSTVPRKVRSLMDSVLQGKYPTPKEWALLRFRWAVKNGDSITLKSAESMPGYSLEQFSFKEEKPFTLALFEKLGVPGNYETLAQYLLNDILATFTERKAIVQEGLDKCKTIDCRPGTAGYEDWSTPSRDERLGAKIQTLRALPIPMKNNPLLKTEVINLDNVSWNLAHMLEVWKNKTYSYDPSTSITRRWGAGGIGWAQDQVSFLQDKFAARKKTLDAARTYCQSASCQFGTTAWSQKSSSATDVEIKKRLIYLNNKENIPAAANDLLDTLAGQSLITINSKNITLSDVALNFGALSSDPNATVERQWNLDQGSTLTFLGTGNFNSYFKDWIIDDVGFKIFSSKTLKRISLEGPVLGFSKADPIVYIKGSNQLVVRNLQTGQSATLPFAEGSKIFAGSQSRFLIVDGKQSTLWSTNAQLELKTLQTIASEKVEQWMPGCVSIDGKILDLDYLHTYSFTAEQMSTVFNHPELIAVKVSGSSKAQLLNRAKGALIDLPTQAASPWDVGFASDLSSIASANERVCTVVHVDADFKSLDTTTLQGFCYLDGNTLYVMGKNEMTEVYKLEEGKLTLTVKAERLREVTENHYVTYGPEGNTLWELKTKKPLISAKIMRLSGNYAFFLMSDEGFEGFVHMMDLTTGKIIFTDLFGFPFIREAVRPLSGGMILTSPFDGNYLWR